jgi:carbamoyltransferase
MRILGIHCETHESAIALLENGELTFAASEERYSRRKMDTAAPVVALQRCLANRGISAKDIDVVAVSGFGPPKNWLMYALSFVRQKRFVNWQDMATCRFMRRDREVLLRGVTAVAANLAFCTGAPQFGALYLSRMAQIKRALRGFKGEYVFVPHHIGHAAGACYSSGHETALSVVMEGYDWEHTFGIDLFDAGILRPVARTPWPHSAGYFYALVTQILGFNYLRHAGKITGLAAYGDPTRLYDKVAKLIWTDGMELRTSPLIYTLLDEYISSRRMPAYFAGDSKEDLAAAFQRRLEDVCVEVVTRAVQETGRSQLVLSGGVAANVLLNRRILRISGVSGVHVHPAMSDAGQAVGAAAHVHASSEGKAGRRTTRRLNDVYLGEDYSDTQIRQALESSGVIFERVSDPEVRVASLLANKKVVARFSGRMEYGPRALGNRSVLCHAEDNSVNAWLNQRLERTEFMPFAPTILYEDRHLYLTGLDGAENAAEFMTIAVDCTDRMKRECPAVVHIDGTARPQLIRREVNPSYYRILEEYKKIAGVGVLLNTSFNMHEEPIVCSPDDAVRSFLRGHLDYLAIGNYIAQSRADAMKVAHAGPV